MILSDQEVKAISDAIRAFNSTIMEMGCDSVQIVATAHTGGDTWTRFALGMGNLYARHGAIVGWMKSQDGIVLADEISEALEER